MVTVGSCLCFDLETGGLILGWLGIIGNAILGLFMIALIAGFNVMTCQDLLNNEQLKEMLKGLTERDCQYIKSGFLAAIIILLVFSIIGFIIEVLLVKGIKSRNPGKILPAVIIGGIGTVSYILKNLFSFTIEGLLVAIIGGAISVYLFLVLYSVYVKIRDEKRRSYNTQYAHA